MAFFIRKFYHSACYCVNVSGQRKSVRILEIIFTEKFSLSWPNKQRVSHPIVTNNSVCKTLQARSEQLKTSTDKEDQEAELKLFVCFKGRSFLPDESNPYLQSFPKSHELPPHRGGV